MSGVAVAGVGMTAFGRFPDRRIDAIMFRVLPDADRLATGLVDLGFSAQVSLHASTESGCV